MSTRRRFLAACVSAASGLSAVFAALPGPAEADTHVRVGIGVGVPLYAPYGYGYRYPYPYPYWGPPAYWYGPPAVIYAPPPPPVVYAPPPAAANAVPVSPPYIAKNGQTCREYRTQVNVGGKMQPGVGTACLQPDGTWRLMN